MSDSRRLLDAEESKGRDDGSTDQVNRLTSLFPSYGGGLQSSSKTSTEGPSKSPDRQQGKSLLGLDRLAEQKRNDESNVGTKSTFNKASFKSQKRKRNYRQTSGDDKPSSRREEHGGGRDGRGGLRGDGPRDRTRRDDDRNYQRPQFNEARSSTRSHNNSNSSNNNNHNNNNASNRSNNNNNNSPIARSHGNNSRAPPRSNIYDKKYTTVETNEEKSDDKDDNVVYDSDGADFDRQFYLADEEGYVVDASEMEGSGQLGRFLFVNDKMKAREKDMEERRRKGKMGLPQQQKQQKAVTARQSAMADDQNAWEENRLLSSGAASRGEVALDISTENDERVTLLVHQLKPPFLEKASVGVLGKQAAVATVKDNSSDFCKMAREGSVTLQRLRQEKDKNTMRQKFWELGGTKMGNAMRVKKEEPKLEPDATTSEAPEGEDGELDFKKSTGYASHMNKQKKEAVSEFAKTKSIRQQREFLPIFSVREELLNVIRENNVVVSIIRMVLFAGFHVWPWLTRHLSDLHRLPLVKLEGQYIQKKSFWALSRQIVSRHSQSLGRDLISFHQWKDYSAGSVSFGRGLLQWRIDCRLYTAKKSRRYECCKAC